MNYNYHAHTNWCDHASGTTEEHIRAAIAGGIRYLGFSEHASWIFPDGHESGFRVPMAKARAYVAEVRRLREVYKDLVELNIGMEMEYYPLYFPQMLQTVRELGVEYLILGQHFLGNEHPNGQGSTTPTRDEDLLAEFAQTVSDGIKTGVFTYVAHPDMFNFTGELQSYRREMVKICEASGERNIPLEVNFQGIRDGRNYPDERFWKLAGECGCPVTFGCDAHALSCASDEKSLRRAQAMVEQYRLNYIGKPELILL